MAVSPQQSAISSPYRWTYSAGAAAPRLARQAVDRQLSAVTSMQERRVIRLLVSELVTNAVAHGPERGTVVVRVDVMAHVVRVEVDDAGPGFAVRWPPALREDGTTGYGLVLVDHTATRWGVADTARTRVWFELDR